MASVRLLGGSCIDIMHLTIHRTCMCNPMYVQLSFRVSSTVHLTFHCTIRKAAGLGTIGRTVPRSAHFVHGSLEYLASVHTVQKYFAAYHARLTRSFRWLDMVGGGTSFSHFCVVVSYPIRLENRVEISMRYLAIRINSGTLSEVVTFEVNFERANECSKYGPKAVVRCRTTYSCVRPASNPCDIKSLGPQDGWTLSPSNG